MTTKIQLSHAEMQLMCDADVILTKNSVLQKTTALLERVQEAQVNYQKEKETFLPADVFAVPPKISRGENYEGLPWLVLDYPRLFTRSDTFAIRTFFWWGRFFSCTLQLSGFYKSLFQPKIIEAYPQLAPAHFIGIGTDPWQHHFNKENYKPIAELTQKEMETFVTEHSFIKIATQFPLSSWPQADALLLQSWQTYLQLLVK